MSYVDALLPSISQNLHRIRDIQFFLHCASIPDLTRWLIGEATVLKSLVLTQVGGTESATAYIHEDGKNYGSRHELCFSAPELTNLSLDFRTFVQACNLDKAWLARAPKLTKLSLTPSKSPLPEPHSVGSTIRALSHASLRELLSLSIRGIDFFDDYAAYDPSLSFSRPMAVMTFQDLKGADVEPFIYAVDSGFDGLTTKHCTFEGLDCLSITTACLILEDLDEDCNLTAPFRDLSTIEASFVRCPAFNDSFLDFMTDGLAGSHNDFPATGMTSLDLADCTNFSVEKLYRMVLARRRARETNPAWEGSLSSSDWNEPNAIESLYVAGGPYLSEEQRTKFKELVPHFEWLSAANTSRAIDAA